MRRSCYFIIIFGISVVIALFVHWHTSKGLRAELDTYLSEQSKLTDVKVASISMAFQDVHQGLRAIARLPGVRNYDAVDHFSKNERHTLDAESVTTIHEIFNSLNLAISVDEVYVVPLDFDPNGAAPEIVSPARLSPELVDFVVGTDHDVLFDIFDLDERDPGIAKVRYNIIRDQIDWYEQHFPNNGQLKGSSYPMLSGPLSIAKGDAASSEHGKLIEQSTVIVSVPYFDDKGTLRGCISGVIVTYNLSRLLVCNDYVILNTMHEYSIEASIPGQWNVSHPNGLNYRSDHNLKYSEVRQIPTFDHMGSWSLWVGRPDAMFKSRIGVQAMYNTRYVGFAAVFIFMIGSMTCVRLLTRAYDRLKKMNTGLEEIVIKRTAALVETKNTAIQAFEREQSIAAELLFQKRALDEHAIVSITDIHGNIIYANDKFCEISGYAIEELMGNTHRMIKSGEHDKEFYRNLWKTISSGKIFHGELKNLAKDGSHYWVDVSIVPFKDANNAIIKYVAIRSDITELKEQESQLREKNNKLTVALKREQITANKLEHAMIKLEKLATTDKLTGLPNRGMFLDRLENAMNRSRRDDGHFAILFFDLDEFKLVNDSLGHEIGDLFLCNIASILRHEVRDSDTVARYGGDEFLILLDNLTNTSDALVKAELLLEALATPQLIDDEHLIVPRVSMGLVTNECNYETSTDMVRDADIAMYDAKQKGGGQIVVYDESMQTEIKTRLSYETDLRKAIDSDQLRLEYQPIVDLENGKVIGFESLIRWDHPELGLISPLNFIPLSEDTGMIIPIGNWVLKTAAAQIAKWNQQSEHERLKVFINISKIQLIDPEFVNGLVACTSGLDSNKGDIVLELTESSIVEHLDEVTPILKKIQALGYHVAVDDFGKGVSSFSNMHKLPVDLLKIDQMFIRTINEDDSLLEIVSSVTKLANQLGIMTVAVGIETKSTLEAMQLTDCTYGQGYYCSKPLSVAEVESFLDENKKLLRTKRAA